MNRQMTRKKPAGSLFHHPIPFHPNHPPTPPPINAQKRTPLPLAMHADSIDRSDPRAQTAIPSMCPKKTRHSIFDVAAENTSSRPSVRPMLIYRFRSFVGFVFESTYLVEKREEEENNHRFDFYLHIHSDCRFVTRTKPDGRSLERSMLSCW